MEMDTGVPLAGVAIRLIAQDRPEVARLTDDRGRAFFTELVPGRYGIVIDRLGYGEARTSLNVPASSLVAVTVELAPEVLELETDHRDCDSAWSGQGRLRREAAPRLGSFHHQGGPRG